MSQTEMTALDGIGDDGVDNGDVRTRSMHGALLFPEVIWSHYCWQHALHPERFARSRNGNRAADGDVGRLYLAYRKTLDQFEESVGEIVDAYWCLTDASAVVLTKKNASRWAWLRRGKQDLRLYRATDWVTSNAPRIAALLHHSDALAIKANQVLPRVPKRILLNWIFSEQSFLLGVIERTGGKPHDKDLDEVVEEHTRELQLIERYYDRAASKSARMVYFTGMLVGLLLLAGVGAGVPGLLGLFADLDVHSRQTQNFFACYGAGAVGAIVSVMLRMRPDTKKGFSVDYEVGRAPLFWLGSFRPVIGAVFGTVVYFALESGLVQFGTSTERGTFYFFAFVGFLAGFSERFTQVIFGEAELTVAQALGGSLAGHGVAKEDEGEAEGQTDEGRGITT